jgi:flagellin-specific chaperone FliS
MLEIKKVLEKARQYAIDNCGEEKILFDPIFRKEDSEYYIGIMIVDLDEKNDIKRPTKWMLLDIENGDLKAFYDSKDKDYNQDLPIGITFKNVGNQSLYEYSNYILESFQNFNVGLMEKLVSKTKEDNDPIKDKKVLKIGDELIAPKDYVMSNIQPVLAEVYETFNTKIGDSIQKAYSDFYDYLVESIRKNYIENKEIDKKQIGNYLDLLKYSWPDTTELINSFNNI